MVEGIGRLSWMVVRKFVVYIVCGLYSNVDDVVMASWKWGWMSGLMWFWGRVQRFIYSTWWEFSRSWCPWRRRMESDSQLRDSSKVLTKLVLRPRSWLVVFLKYLLPSDRSTARCILPPIWHCWFIYGITTQPHTLMIHLAEFNMNSHHIMRLRLEKPIAKLAHLQVTRGNDGTGIICRTGHL